MSPIVSCMWACGPQLTVLYGSFGRCALLEKVCDHVQRLKFLVRSALCLREVSCQGPSLTTKASLHPYGL